MKYLDFLLKKMFFPMKNSCFFSFFSMGFMIFLSACSVLKPVHLSNLKLHQIESESLPISQCHYYREESLLIFQTGSAQAFQTSKMAYQLQKNQIQYFALNQWVDMPLSQWTQLFLEYQIQKNHFQSVAISPNIVTSDSVIQFYLLESIQDFSTRPSVARFKLMATLINEKNKKTLASQIFSIQVPLQKNNPSEGVIAMQKAMYQMLNSVDCWMKSKI